MSELTADRENVLQYAAEHFGTSPEYLWARLPDAAVLRDSRSKKWYGIIMSVRLDRFIEGAEGVCDVINVKTDPLMTGSLLMQAGFYPAYHMNKTSWISILLDGSVPLSRVTSVLEMSFALVRGKAKGAKRTEPKDWLIPSNPKYITLDDLFRDSDTTLWKQVSRMIPGDTVYIYEALPVGAITYVCTVTETDIPFHFEQDGLYMDTAFRIRVLRRLPPDAMTREHLRDFGITGIRGPRGIPDDLLAALKSLAGE